jgi:hypothetical protein
LFRGPLWLSPTKLPMEYLWPLYSVRITIEMADES